MIPLESRGRPIGIAHTVIGRVSRSPVADGADRADTVRLLGSGTADEPLEEYLAVLSSAETLVGYLGPAALCCSTDHLQDGDVVSIDPRGVVRTLYRRHSRSNSLFATERCNSFCLMCSQPPRQVDDDWRVHEMLRVVALAHSETAELGITGGEPTLLGDGLLRVLAACRDRLPRTALHILSNGRQFKDLSFARRLGGIGHPDLMVGVPLYSDIDCQHDYVVQAFGAFDETLVGLHHLALCDVPVEIRVVVHKGTFRRLPQLARFIYRNLTFAAHVTFMGLEMIGFAKANAKELWTDPADYRDELEEAVLDLSTAGMSVSIYNHQLCTLPTSLWSFSRQSISDWKVAYDPLCKTCAVKSDCGGFFAWNAGSWKSRAITPVVRSGSDVVL